MKCKRAKTCVIKTHRENQDFSLSHLSESEVDTTKFVPWCRITRDSPSSLAVVREGVAAETAQSKAVPYPACCQLSLPATGVLCSHC